MRIYTVTFRNEAVLGSGGGTGAALDLFSFVPVANKPIKLLSLILANADPANGGEEQLQIEIIRGYSTPAALGNNPTPEPVSNIGAAGFTARTVCPTLATGGTPHYLHCDGWNLHSPFGPLIWPPEMIFECSAGFGTNMVVRMTTIPNGDLKLNGVAYVGEEG